MGNISNFNLNKIDMRLTNVNYWDFYLADGDFTIVPNNSVVSGDCLVSHYDFNIDEIYGVNDDIYSLTSSTWSNAVNTGYTLDTIGLTGLDNGLIDYEKVSGDTKNLDLLSALTGTTLIIPSGDTRLHLTRVSGYTNQYEYPIEIVTGDTVGTYAKLCGGFYQGYYKLDGTNYEILPNRVPKSWTAELWLRKPSVNGCSGYTGTILNDDYSGNTGFFLYFGTRAENKFWNIFNGLNTGSTSGCTSGATEWCTIPKETDMSVVDNNGNLIPLSPPPVDLTVSDNKFLFFSRASDTTSTGGGCGRCGGIHSAGETTCTWTGGTDGTKTIRTIRTEITDDRNPFLIFSRASDTTSTGGGCGRCGGIHPAGETTCTYSGRTSPLLELDRDSDLVDNAIGFRITEDGAIGYRKLIVTANCVNDITVTGCTIEESYSDSGIITEDEWKMVSIRFIANETLDECELEYKPARKGKLMFYVNRRLIHVVNDFDEFIARRLMEHDVKQVSVPYNISLGGGTQGLIESMTFDGQDSDDMGSCLQNNFAGTFVGDISQFRFYICDMNYCSIKNNFEQERERYGLLVTV